jgi:hypothetical protein
VLVDGRPAARSNGSSKEAKVENLTAGSHTIQVQKNEYEVNPKEQKVKVIADKDTKVPGFTLIAKPEVITPSTGTTPSKPVTETAPVVGGNSNPPPLPTTTTPKPAPVINSFKAEPSTVDAGSKTRLVWSVQNADKVVLKPGDVTKGPNDSYEVEVKEGETPYELIATGAGGSAVEKTTVTGRKKPTATEPQLDAKPAILAALERWRLAYESLDKARITEAWPDIPPDVLNRILDLKRHGMRLNVKYNNPDPRVVGDSAEMKCTETLTVVQASGSALPPHTQPCSMGFVHRGDIWVRSGGH